MNGSLRFGASQSAAQRALVYLTIRNGMNLAIIGITTGKHAQVGISLKGVVYGDRRKTKFNQDHSVREDRHATA